MWIGLRLPSRLSKPTIRSRSPDEEDFRQFVHIFHDGESCNHSFDFIQNYLNHQLLPSRKVLLETVCQADFIQFCFWSGRNSQKSCQRQSSVSLEAFFIRKCLCHLPESYIHEQLIGKHEAIRDRANLFSPRAKTREPGSETSNRISWGRNREFEEQNRRIREEPGAYSESAR